MYIDKNKPGVFNRSFHRFLCVLSASTVLFSVSGCSGTMKTDKGNEPAALRVESQTPVETETLSADYLSTGISSDNSATTATPADDSNTTEAPSGDSTTTEVPSDDSTTTEVPSDDSTTTEVPSDDSTTTEVPSDDSATTEVPSDDSTTTEVPSETSSTSEVSSEELPGYTVTQAEINLETLERLNSTYGVNIRYGSEVSWSYGASGSGITDDELITSRLTLLEECLNLYPKELFADLGSFSPIIINLIDNLGGADGYTDARNASSIQIALSSSNSDVYFKLAFHHELFHFIEYCIIHYVENGQSQLDTDELTDTTLYGTDDYAGTIYDSGADIYHQYFTSIYGKTNGMEDRAELFSYYMGYTVKECMKVNDSPINLKMKKIAYAIRLCCPSLSEYPEGTLPWEEKISY